MTSATNPALALKCAGCPAGLTYDAGMKAARTGQLVHIPTVGATRH